MASNIGLGWSEVDKDEVKRRWAAGESASEISRALTNRSRNAVISVVHRMKLEKRSKAATTAESRATKSRGGLALPVRGPRSGRPNGLAFKVAAGRKNGLELNEVMAKPVVSPLPDEDLSGVDVTHLVKLMDLKTNDCRFPYGDPLFPNFGFCGKPTQGNSSWCPDHHARVFPGRS